MFTVQYYAVDYSAEVNKSDQKISDSLEAERKTKREIVNAYKHIQQYTVIHQKIVPER